MIADKVRLISSLPAVVNALVLCIECSSLRDGIIARTDLAISSLLSQIAGSELINLTLSAIMVSTALRSSA